MVKIDVIPECSVPSHHRLSWELKSPLCFEIERAGCLTAFQKTLRGTGKRKREVEIYTLQIHRRKSFVISIHLYSGYFY